MNRRIGTAVFACLLASTAHTAPAKAQSSPPPRFLNVDDNGVDLTTGSVSFSLTEGSIGSGEGAVAMQRFWAQGAGWTDNWSGGMYATTIGGAAKTVVQLGAISDVFTQNGTTFTSDNGRGATLVRVSSSFHVYTTSDGTKIEFVAFTGDGGIAPQACLGTNPNGCNLPISIIKPNGLKFMLGWDDAIICVWHQGECILEKHYYRLGTVISSAGYSLTIGYATNNIGPPVNPAWYQRTSVTFNNSAAAPSPLPTVTYAYPSAGVTDVTDPAGRVWRLTTATNQLTGIRRPGSASDNITYAYTSGLVSSATRDGVTTNYSRVDVGSVRTTTVTNALSQQSVVVADLTKTRPTSFRDPLLRTTSFLFDANARPTRTTAPEGNYVELTYDARGNATQTRAVAKAGSGLADIIASATYDATCANIVKCNKPNTTTDPRGKVTDYTYDAVHGGPLTVTAPAPTTGAVRPQTRFAYTAITSASGQLVTLPTKVSACQTLASCDNAADESRTVAAYNSNLVPISVARGNGTGTLTATTTATYDPRGNVLTVDGPLAGTADTTTYRYDAARQVVGTISPDPDGASALKRRAVRTTYRPDGQVSKQELGTVNGTTDVDWAAFAPLETIDVTFDANSRVATQKLSGGATAYALTQISYDALGRLDCATTRMNPAIYAALPASACTLGTAGTFGPDRIAKTVYDAAGQITQQQVAVGLQEPAERRGVDPRLVMALLILGWIYETGATGSSDKDVARSYYERAASQGSSTAYFDLGRVLLAQGEEVQGRTAFKSGAERGDIPSMSELGRMMVEGRGGPVDADAGPLWLQKAAAQGHIFAQRTLLDIEERTARSIFEKLSVRKRIAELAIKGAREMSKDPYSERLR